MTLEDLLNEEDATPTNFENYFKTVGIKHINRENLDMIIDKFGVVVFKMYCFSEVYKLVLERETSKRMHTWTYVIGIMTIVYTVLTILMFLKN
ncbi:MAG: hypothetical protein PHQ32_05975 [Firmicutes bacterium]|nr:hypothetical protein [Bacillota bacterium]